MGNKLGKMVKNINTLFILLMSISISANIPIISKNHFEETNNATFEDEIAQIYRLPSNRFGISKINSSTGKPSKMILRNMKLLTPSDEFALQVLDSDKNEIFLIGLGNPFYIHAQHIGYEESNFFGGYIDAEIRIALPLNADASYFVLMSQENKFLKKISEVKVK